MDLLFLDQSGKSPDSGLQADGSMHQASFSPHLPNKREEGLPDRKLHYCNLFITIHPLPLFLRVEGTAVHSLQHCSSPFWIWHTTFEGHAYLLVFPLSGDYAGNFLLS